MNVVAGQIVKLRVTVWEPSSGESPGGMLGKKGDELIVKSVTTSGNFPIEVHHKHITDGSAFRVRHDELVDETK